MDFFEAIIALTALTAMEVVLGIDNIVFIAILTSRVPKEMQSTARKIGLGLAMLMRVLLLLSLSFILQLDTPIFYLSNLGVPVQGMIEGAEQRIHELESDDASDEVREEIVELEHKIETYRQIDGVSWKDLILLAGGLFLIWKSVHEIHKKFESGSSEKSVAGQVSFRSALVNIALMDIVFSIDSVITAVGMVRAEGESFWLGIGIMVTAVMIAVGVMLIFADPVSRFVERHASVKMLALSFLILIGVMLVAEGIGTHFNKGYIYFAMAFSLVVEMLNLRVSRRRKATSES